MKEIMAIIRMNMVEKTKEALLKGGNPAITCLKVLGRGRQKVDFSMIEDYIPNLMDQKMAEELSEIHRLISKRLIIILAKDEDVKEIVDEIIEVNRTGNPGDGKIFVINIADAMRIRTEETGDMAI
ncbi:MULTISPECIES: P-II family nitrogen regulator [Clostridium]|uniref:Nitrogen regulatory protein PII (Nitrogen fixation nifHD) n=2 Tax=Clostridium acetobutylicum TaxID=1488 RepID=Q97ME3_CLOAB|nr:MULTISPECIES: P-II family nitrogen regulator [Clostridium]AAK78236.1 Nitrogen regulatory protein PII (nitrogen fixation nifHD) [Clostridium acetobutylicum ATCC 824]ADZ19302.1 Nitrogen regulatory protein PII (nitrogen fixation nifHD) [Clostridium acetobutylicum EA 2018]AEI33609.1 nitrogen regulatory protein PII (nitrogen fixation NifHD) [Clostridium acetobutylicum DSM 1731]AWV82043.1 P-II family nitrogen regulator [Clostridium acetobutylicum]MBC2396089.1 P-II family nitrogen regulator [Clost